MPHVTISSMISSTMDSNVAKIAASSAHRHEIVDEIVTCGIAFYSSCLHDKVVFLVLYFKCLVSYSEYINFSSYTWQIIALILLPRLYVNSNDSLA